MPGVGQGETDALKSGSISGPLELSSKESVSLDAEEKSKASRAAEMVLSEDLRHGPPDLPEIDRPSWACSATTLTDQCRILEGVRKAET